MELQVQVKPTLILTFFLTIMVPSGLVRPWNLASSPSSELLVNGELVGMDNNLFKRGSEKARRGSSPAYCHSKCNQCMPCMPVAVTVQAEEQEENEYYPLVWRCICHGKVFSP